MIDACNSDPPPPCVHRAGLSVFESQMDLLHGKTLAALALLARLVKQQGRLVESQQLAADWKERT